MDQYTLFAVSEEQQAEAKPTNTYEQRQEAKRKRLLNRADRARRESTAAYERSQSIVGGIPMGQPILVGHHSERRHRRDLERSDNAMRKSVEQKKKAEHLEQRAASVGMGGISSDDPEAIRKVKEKLAGREEAQAKMKATNAAFKKGGWDEVERRGLISHEGRVKCEAAMAKDWMPVAKRRPFASFQLSNNNAEISRLKKRIAQLEQQDQMTDTEQQHEGFTYAVETGDNRVRFYFDGKPAENVRAILKRAGFRWSPRAGAWQRQATQNGISSAEYVLPQIKEAMQAA